MNDTTIRAGAKLAARAQKWRYTVDERCAMEGVARILMGIVLLPKQARQYRPRPLGMRDRLRNRPLGVRDVFMSAEL